MLATTDASGTCVMPIVAIVWSASEDLRLRRTILQPGTRLILNTAIHACWRR